MTTADVLTNLETCERKGLWANAWLPRRSDMMAALRASVSAGLSESARDDFGEVAGETMMEIATDPGIEMPGQRLHESVIHHAALADMLTTAIRKPKERSWVVPPPANVAGEPWTSSAFLDPSGNKLRRVVLTGSWSDARHYSEMRNWYALGEVAMYGLPMTMVVVILGQSRDSKRWGPWTRGFLHPNNRKLRFRKKTKATSEVFSDRWTPIWREDHAEIGNRDWLQAMLDDDILRDVCFPVEISVQPMAETERIRDMAKRKLDRLAKMTKVPEASLGVCDRPPCSFRKCCWNETPAVPSQANGFVSISGGSK